MLNLYLPQRNEKGKLKRLGKAKWPPVPGTSRYKNYIKVWKTKLAGFYDIEYVIDGITHGVYIGINGDDTVIDRQLSQGKKFFFQFSAKQRSAVTDWILRGHDEGYISGPFPPDFPFPFKLHTSPLFVVPKPKFDEWRTIWHGSWKDNDCLQSLNELVNEQDKNVRYLSRKELAAMVLAAIGDKDEAWLLAGDAHDAYYRIPLHVSQYKYMGIKWLNKLWIFQSLQMGLSSACRTYTRFADAIEYAIVKENKDIMFEKDVQLLGHYLDDFVSAQPTLERAQIVFKSIGNTFSELNVPTKPEKMKLPMVR